MDERERQQMLNLLTDGTEAIHNSAAGLDDSQATLRPATGNWSVLDCLEHVAITERMLFTGIRNATKAQAPQPNPERETKIWNRALDRARFIAAPDIVVPQGNFTNVAQVLLNFTTARAETVHWVETFADDPRAWITTHPMVRGPVNCWEMLLMIALHPKRHAQQVAHIRASLSHH